MHLEILTMMQPPKNGPISQRAAQQDLLRMTLSHSFNHFYESLLFGYKPLSPDFYCGDYANLIEALDESNTYPYFRTHPRIRAGVAQSIAG